MMDTKRIVIDGAAGTGKSTIGELLAKNLGYLYVDTGAMYRAAAWLALQRDSNLQNGDELAHLVQRSTIVISHASVNDGRQYTVSVDGQDITWEIRDTLVTRTVSIVSAYPQVRSLLIAQQREMACNGAVVMVGRDIGSVVLPDAELKLFLLASLEVRARRRHAELVNRLGEQHPQLSPFTDVLEDIRRRDALDKQNMQPARDAIMLDTDNKNVQQVLDCIYPHLYARTAQQIMLR